jgi:hypothetical protein
MTFAVSLHGPGGPLTERWTPVSGYRAENPGAEVFPGRASLHSALEVSAGGRDEPAVKVDALGGAHTAALLPSLEEPEQHRVRLGGEARRSRP